MDVTEVISKARTFINAESTVEITPTFALTIEPRLSAAGLPPVSYHLSVVFDNGEKSVIYGFEGLFKHFRMLDFLRKSSPGTWE